jgi:hypothetical protein
MGAPGQEPDNVTVAVEEGAGAADDAERKEVPAIVLHAKIHGEELTEGTIVTIRAEIEGMPEGIGYGLQWQNDLSGEFLDVPGATEDTIAFLADEKNVHCVWRVRLTLPGDDWDAVD